MKYRTLGQTGLKVSKIGLGVIAGAKNRQQVEDNTATSEMPPLTHEELSRALPIADVIGTAGWIG